MATDPATAPPDVIVDAGPLIHLDELECLDLLDDFPMVMVAEQVWQEVLQHRPDALTDPPSSWLRQEVEIPQERDFQVLARSFALHTGELAAITLLRQHPRGILLTDDTAARFAAKSLGYRSHGTLGIMLRSIRRRQRTQAEILDLLRKLPEVSTLHVRNDLREGIIQAVERETYSAF